MLAWLSLFVAALSLVGCSDPKVRRDEPRHDEPRHIEANCGRPMEAGVQKYSENSSNEVSDRLLGVVNIMERDLADASGHSRRRLSVELIVFDPATKDERHHKLAAGSVVPVGADEYCLVEVVEGRDNDLGWVSLRRLVPPAIK